jgi:hypothetical protein
MKHILETILRIWYDATPNEEFAVWAACWLGFGVFCWYTGTPL